MRVVKTLRGVWLVTFLWVGTTVVLFAAPPEPSESKLLKVRGGGITINVDKDGAIYQYAITLTIKNPQSAPLYLKVAYDDPLAPNTPMLQQVETRPNQQEIVLSSNPVVGVENQRLYDVRVFIYADEKRTQLIDKLTQSILYSVNEEVVDGLRTAFTESASQSSEQLPTSYEKYEDTQRSIHIRYPTGWHVRVEDTQDAHEVFLSREPIVQPTDRFSVGISLFQYKNMEAKLKVVDFSNPDLAAKVWMALEKRTVDCEAQSFDKRQFGGWGGYSSSWSCHPQGGYPIRTGRIYRFYPKTFSELFCEAPEEEYEKYKQVFDTVINDKEFSF